MTSDPPKPETGKAAVAAPEKTTLRLCVNFRANNLVDSCGAHGSRELASALKQGLAERDLPFDLQTVHCMSKCHLGPTLKVMPDGPFIMGAQKIDVPEMLKKLEEGDIDGLAKKFPLIERDT